MHGTPGQGFRAALTAAVMAFGCAEAGEPPRLCDSADLLAEPDERALRTQRALLSRELAVDVAWQLGNDTSGLGAESPAERWRVGTDGRGLLLRYDEQDGRLRIDVGYALEPYLPDAFTGRWIARHLEPLFAAGRPAAGLLLTSRMLQDRLRAGGLAEEPRSAPRAHGFGGAGAAGRAPLDRSALPFAEAQSLAAPGPARTVRGAYARYRRWLERGRFEADATLFTASTRAFLAGWPMTPGYLAHILWKERRCQFASVQRSDAALLFCTDDPHVAPHFFRRSPGGWQMDLASEAREVVNLAGGRFSWAFRDAASPALVRFVDALVDVDGFLRLRDGDNRPAPVASPAVRRQHRRDCERNV